MLLRISVAYDRSRRSMRQRCTQTTLSGLSFPPQESKIVPGLYLADAYTATCPEVLQRLGIIHVLSMINMDKFQGYAEPIQHLVISVHDYPDVDIGQHFERAIAWMKEALLSEPAQVPLHSELDSDTDKNLDWETANSTSLKTAPKKSVVMVHCKLGMSRSATIVVAYLMATRGMSLNTALNFAKERRIVVHPNRGFMEQLRTLETKQRSKNSMVCDS